MSLHDSELQNLSTDQISSTYLNLKLTYNYFRLGKNNRTPAILKYIFWVRLQPYHSNWRSIMHQTASSSKSGHLRQSNGIQFQDGSRGGAILLPVRIWWCYPLPKVSVYPQIKFRRHIRCWDTTTYGLKKSMRPLYWNSFLCDFDQVAIICVLFCIRLPNSPQSGHPQQSIMT